MLGGGIDGLVAQQPRGQGSDADGLRTFAMAGRPQGQRTVLGAAVDPAGAEHGRVTQGRGTAKEGGSCAVVIGATQHPTLQGGGHEGAQGQKRRGHGGGQWERKSGQIMGQFEEISAALTSVPQGYDDAGDQIAKALGLGEQRPTSGQAPRALHGGEGRLHVEEEADVDLAQGIVIRQQIAEALEHREQSLAVQARGVRVQEAIVVVDLRPEIESDVQSRQGSCGVEHRPRDRVHVVGVGVAEGHQHSHPQLLSRALQTRQGVNDVVALPQRRMQGEQGVEASVLGGDELPTQAQGNCGSLPGFRGNQAIAGLQPVGFCRRCRQLAHVQADTCSRLL